MGTGRPPSAARCLVAAAVLWLAGGPAAAAVSAAAVSEAASDEGAPAALQDELRALRERIEALEAAPGLRSREAIDLVLSGQISRGILIGHDGSRTDLHHVDNDASSSRVLLLATRRADDHAARFGAALEFDFQLNNSYSIGQDGGPDVRPIRARRVELWVEHPGAGRLWAGQGWTATEFSSEQDLSGTALAGYSEHGSLGGGMRFRDLGGEHQDNPRLIDVFASMDGLGRAMRLRYDTPAGLLGPAQLRISLIQDSGRDVALFFDEPLGPFRLQAALAHVFSAPDLMAFRRQSNGSASLLAPNGLSLTVAAGRRSAYRAPSPARVGTNRYIKIGKRATIWAIGPTAFSLDHSVSRHIGLPGDRARAVGLQFVQHLTPWSADLSIALRRHTLKRSGRAFDPLITSMIALRVPF